MSRRKTNQEFLVDAQVKHPDLYEYLSPYRTAITKVHLRCRRCGGEFMVTPNSHLGGSGCEPCNRRGSRDGVRYSQGDLLIKMSALHGGKYGYDLGDYRSVDKNILITCPEHGPFKATPSNHLKGKGCPKCAKYGFNPVRPSYLYLLAATLNGEEVVKVGITHNLRQRLMKNRKADGIDWWLLGVAWYPDGFLPQRFEKILMNFFGTPFLGKERFFFEHVVARNAFARINVEGCYAI